MPEDPQGLGSSGEAASSEELGRGAPTVEQLQVELAARDKTIKVLIARMQGQLANKTSAVAVIEQNLSLERVVKRRTRELGESHDSLARALENLRQAQSQLLENSKLEAIGQLAAGIAHEINTPIQYVSDNATFLETAFEKVTQLLDEVHDFAAALDAEGLAPSRVSALRETLQRLKIDWLRGEIPRALAETAEGLGRVSAIVGAMKEFSHPSTGEKEPVDLHEAINTTITVARHEWKYVADVETEFDSELRAVPCHRNELSQALLNLIVNAAHAIGERGERPGKGKIVVMTEKVGQEVEIRVKDDGVGMPAAVATRVYDPFFTTKEVGKGTGQGLAMARSTIVDRHGGSIRFESEPGVGTCFFVRLPLEPSPIQALERS
ncbi:MAG TPA: ATP-binding protein [Polyangiaceae bacterium]|nr:ATP-binding protein [Polyangiaceae bacterium]